MKIDNVGRISKSGKRFEWSIPHFLRYARDDMFVFLHSPVFSSSGVEWRLILAIPDLRRGTSISFNLRPTRRLCEAAATPVTLTHGIKTSYREIVNQRINTSTLSEIEALYLWTEVTCADLWKFMSRYLPYGTLTLDFHLQIGDGSVPSDGEERTTQALGESLSRFDYGTTEVGDGSVPSDGVERTTQAPGDSLSRFDYGTTEESERQTRSVEECPRCKNRIDKTAEKDTERPQGVEESPHCKNSIDKTAEKYAEKTKNLAKLSDDFKDLLLNETDTDVVLKVGDKEFKAHRLIIRTRSPVLFAMFAHDTEERRTGVVRIEDCDPDTFTDFLRYIYTGRVEALTEHKALHLYRTADKYQVMELKEQCLELLKTSICIDNFCDVLALSLQHSERELTEIATQFFLDNSFEIARTPRWQTFLQENPTTANELCLKSFQKGR